MFCQHLQELGRPWRLPVAIKNMGARNSWSTTMAAGEEKSCRIQPLKYQKYIHICNTSETASLLSHDLQGFSTIPCGEPGISSINSMFTILQSFHRFSVKPRWELATGSPAEVKFPGISCPTKILKFLRRLDFKVSGAPTGLCSWVAFCWCCGR